MEECKLMCPSNYEVTPNLRYLHHKKDRQKKKKKKTDSKSHTNYCKCSLHFFTAIVHVKLSVGADP